MKLSTTFYLDVKTAFLNGKGSESIGREGDITRVKQYEKEGEMYPYVSAQAMRKWIRGTVNHLTNQISYYDRIYWKSPNKKDQKQPEGLWIDPVYYIEDDLFGYSHPFMNTMDQDDKRRLNVTVANRLAPYQTTALVSLTPTASINQYDGWVNPGNDTSLPFNTEMMSGIFEGNATLDLDRIGIFKSYGDIIELDPVYTKYYLENNEIEEITNSDLTAYKLINLKKRKLQAAKLYYDSILNLYGAAKSTIMATDLTPRIIITCLLNSANNLFHGIITSTFNGELFIDKDKLLKRINSRVKSLNSNIYIGYRTGTLSEKYEKQLFELDGLEIEESRYKIHILSPGIACKKITNILEELI